MQLLLLLLLPLLLPLLLLLTFNIGSLAVLFLWPVKELVDDPIVSERGRCCSSCCSNDPAQTRWDRPPTPSLAKGTTLLNSRC